MKIKDKIKFEKKLFFNRVSRMAKLIKIGVEWWNLQGKLARNEIKENCANCEYDGGGIICNHEIGCLGNKFNSFELKPPQNHESKITKKTN